MDHFSYNNVNIFYLLNCNYISYIILLHFQNPNTSIWPNFYYVITSISYYLLSTIPVLGTYNVWCQHSTKDPSPSFNRTAHLRLGTMWRQNKCCPNGPKQTEDRGDKTRLIVYFTASKIRLYLEILTQMWG